MLVTQLQSRAYFTVSSHAMYNLHPTGCVPYTLQCLLSASNELIRDWSRREFIVLQSPESFLVLQFC